MTDKSQVSVKLRNGSVVTGEAAKLPALIKSLGYVPEVLDDQPPKYEVSTLGAAGRGLLQGASAGWSDELSGDAKATQEARDKNLIAQEEHPDAYAAAKAVGSVLPTALSTLAFSRAGAGSGAVPLGMGAAGALASVGESEGKTATEATENALKAGALDAALGALGVGGLKVLTKLPVKSLAGKAAAAVLPKAVVTPATALLEKLLGNAAPAAAEQAAAAVPEASPALIKLLPETVMALEREAAEKAAQAAADAAKQKLIEAAAAKTAANRSRAAVTGALGGPATTLVNDVMSDDELAKRRKAIDEALRRLAAEAQ